MSTSKILESAATYVQDDINYDFYTALSDEQPTCNYSLVARLCTFLTENYSEFYLRNISNISINV